jgi:hypothetical protein
MKKAITLTAILLTLGLGSSAAAKDTNDIKLTGNVSLSVANKFLAGPGFVPEDSVSVQPSATLSVSHKDVGTLSATYWANLGDTSTDKQEHDALLNYTSPSLSLGSFGEASANLGWGHIESYGARLQEVNASISVANPLNPSVHVAGDYMDGNGMYGWVAISPSVPLGDKATLNTSVAGVLNSKYFIDSTVFAGVRLDASVALKTVKNTTFSLGVRHFIPTDDNFEEATAVTATVSYDFNIVE